MPAADFTRFQASYANARPARSAVWFPFASYVGLAKPTAVSSFCRLCVRLSGIMFVLTDSQFPAAS